ncbi:MAG: AbrB/MazE/SpoVT family DNA-binding domain-containing protein [Caldilineaceae bacterium]
MLHSVETTKVSDVVTVSSKGWVVIPAEYRKKYGLHAGKAVTIIDYGGVLAIVPLLSNPINQARGLLAGKRSLTQALLRDRQTESAREQ